MGGGNAQKSATARARNDAKKGTDNKGGGAAGIEKRNGGGTNIICSQCKQAFMSTQRKMAEQHQESKHPKMDFKTCFPDVA
jgi:hypothetical protein